ncbi:radical SAM protein [bacterium]|nr:radical SAM protein [bacterium]
MTVAEIRQLIRYRFDRFCYTQRLLAGIFDRSLAFTGPKVVQIDIANTCTNTCLACWIRSPLLHGTVCADPIHSQQLPFGVVERVINDLADLQTQCIYLSGGGNVFTHPDLLEIVRLIKKRGMFVVLHANFVNCSQDEARQLVEAGVDDVTASVWAATPETYVATHPDKTAADFEAMVRVLTIIGQIRNQGGVFRMYNVIMNQNYHELEAMVEFARQCGASGVHFAMVDILPGKTDSLLLDEDQLDRLRDMVQRLDEKRDLYRNQYGLDIRDFDLFKQRVFARLADSGGYDRDQLVAERCYTGWMFLRVLGDGNVNSCLKSWRYPLGNIYQTSIRTIWNNGLQQEFRRKALFMTHHEDYFRLIGNNPSDDIGCYRSCDNIANIIEVRELLERLPEWRKSLARCSRPLYRLQHRLVRSNQCKHW